MKISDLKNQDKILQLQKNQAVQAQTAERRKDVSPEQQTDQVEISRKTRDAQKVQEVLKTTPDVRADKVEALKEKVQKGEYKVDSKKVASAMLSNLLQDLP